MELEISHQQEFMVAVDTFTLITYYQGWEGCFGNVIGYRLLVTLFKM